MAAVLGTAIGAPLVVAVASSYIDSAREDASSAEPTYSVSFNQCSTFVVPGTVDSLGPAPEAADLPAWALERQGAQTDPLSSSADRRYGQVTLTVAGQKDKAFTIMGLRIRAGERHQEPLEGVEVGNECGGPAEVRFAEADLDADPPVITNSSSVPTYWGSEEVSTTPLKFPYKVTSEDTESLMLIVSTAHYVEWTAELEWASGSESGVLVINNHGQPFRTSAHSPNGPSAIPDGDGEWWLSSN